MKLDGTGKVVKQRELKPARKYRVTTLERFKQILPPRPLCGQPLPPRPAARLLRPVPLEANPVIDQ